MRYSAMTFGLRVRAKDRWRRIAIVLCILMTGCTMSYRDVLQSDYKYTSESLRKPPDVADCVAARMTRQSGWRVTRRPLDDRGAIELIVGSGGEGVAAVAHVYPSPYGSRVESWITQRAVLTRDIWHEEFFGPC
jgi:hypothetical protein